MKDPVEIKGPLIPFSVDRETLEVTINTKAKNGLLEKFLKEGCTVVDKRDNSALIVALKRYDEYRKITNYHSIGKSNFH